MTLTLAQARTVVLDHLDDDNTRWSTSQIDTALGTALSMCLTDYITNGGDRFEIEVDTTSTSSGVVDLSAYNPIKINGVSILESNRYFPITASKTEERVIHDNTVRTVQIRLTRTLSIPTMGTYPLVGVNSTAANSWDAFDQWVCVRAAMFCAIKDDDILNACSRMEQMLRTSVLTLPRIPSARRLPKKQQWLSGWIGYIFHGQDLQLCRRAGF